MVRNDHSGKKEYLSNESFEHLLSIFMSFFFS